MDAKILSKIVGSLYEAAADPKLWDPFLQQLAHITGATSAGLVMLDVGQDVRTISRSWEVDPEATRLYQERYGAIDVWARRGLSKPAGFVCNSEALCSGAEIAKTEIYNDYMVRFGFEHGLFGVAENSGPRWASVSLYRDSSRPTFEQRELGIVRFLAPHMQRAFKLHLQFSELQARSRGLETTFDVLPIGIILLGSKGEVVQMNRSALAFVSEHDGLLATRKGLQAERLAESSLLETAIRSATSPGSGGGASVGGTVMISRRSRPRLQIQISPIRNSSLQASQTIAAVAFVHDPLRQHRPTQEVLRMLYGLTPAECRVALLLGDGHASRKIANTVGVSNNTVRSQIKSIFAKTGVRRQGELIRLLLNNSRVSNDVRQAH
jgi:DNA-binding CsgD family transcriptional regulator/PAS domain-containing protein